MIAAVAVRTGIAPKALEELDLDMWALIVARVKKESR
tara:strand:+ start:287 stop:397 length:111 start_codon:yes stop_codon:yes gene_type:complete